MLRGQKAKLSADELKSKLYAHFDKSGSLNQLRTQLRSHLVSELFKISPPAVESTENNSASQSFDKTLLPLQICNWLIYDHFLRQNLQYSLSTFVSEINIPSPNKFLAAGDILKLFGLDSSNEDYKQISHMYSSSYDGYLHSLLLAVIRALLNNSKTDLHSSKHDNEYANLSATNHKEITSENFSESQFKDSKCQSKEGSKLDIDAENSVKYSGQIELVKEEHKKEIQKLRHKLIEELDRLHSQEHSLQLELEQERKEIKKEKEFLLTEREKIKEKEILIAKEQENLYEKKIQELEEINARKLHSKDKEIEQLQKKLQEKEQKIEKMEFEFSNDRERFDSLKRDLEDANHMYKIVHEKYIALLDENKNLIRKFESMSDYNILKEELLDKSKEITALQQEIEKLHRTAEKDRKVYTETVTDLDLKLKNTESKLQQNQREMNEAKNILRIEETKWSNEKEKLERESSVLKQLYQEILNRFEEQKIDIQDLHQTMHIMHYQLSNKDTNLPIKSQTSERANAYLKDHFMPLKTRISLRNNPANQKSKEEVLDFAAENIRRLNKLKLEMEAGFEKYSIFHCSSLGDKMLNKGINFPTNNYSGFSFDMKMDLTKSKYLSHTSNKYPLLNKMFLSKYDLNLSKTKDAINSNISTSSYTTNRFKEHLFPQNKQATSNLFSQINDKILPSTEEKDNFTTVNSELFSSKTIDISSDKHDECSETTHSILNQPKFFGHGSEKNQINAHENEKTINLIKPNLSTPKSSDHAISSHAVFNAQSKLLPSAQKTVVSSESKLKPLKKYPTLYSDPMLTEEATSKSIDETSSVILSQSKLEQTNEKLTVEANASKETEQSDSYSRNTTSTVPMFVEKPVEVPVVVDLDAAWKRKASLPSVTTSPYENADSNATFAEKSVSDRKCDEDNYSATNMDDSNKILPVLLDKSLSGGMESIPSSTHKALHKADEVSEDILLSSSIVDAEKCDSAQFHSVETVASEAQKLIDKSLAVRDSDDHKGNENQADVLSDKSNEDEILKAQSGISDKSSSNVSNKHIPEDSLSELSEIHMSCGSEQEEPKNDSDNW